MAINLLWDVDGTLIVTDFVAVSIYAQAFERTTGVRPTVPLTNPHGMTEGQLLPELLRIHDLDASLHETFRDHLTDLSSEEHAAGMTRVACAGVAEALVGFAELGWHNGLLTGNAPDRARYKMLQTGFDENWFDWDRSFFGDRSETRHHLTASAAEALAGETVVIIGDTPLDGAAAASAGFPFLGVATGSFSTDELRGAGAFLAIDSFAVGFEEAVAGIRSLASGNPPADA